MYFKGFFLSNLWLVTSLSPTGNVLIMSFVIQRASFSCVAIVAFSLQLCVCMCVRTRACVHRHCEHMFSQHRTFWKGLPSALSLGPPQTEPQCRQRSTAGQHCDGNRSILEAGTSCVSPPSPVNRSSPAAPSHSYKAERSVRTTQGGDVQPWDTLCPLDLLGTNPNVPFPSDA